MATRQDVHSAAVVEAAESLLCDAIAAADSSEAQTAAFYHGVQTAALQVLRPGMTSVCDATKRPDDEASFRVGFLQASTLLATASTAPEPGVRSGVAADSIHAPSGLEVIPAKVACWALSSDKASCDFSWTHVS